MEFDFLLIAALNLVVLVVLTVLKAVRIVRQTRARNVERLGRYIALSTRTQPRHPPSSTGCIPRSTLREQVVSFQAQPVITEDNLVVEIDTVLYLQVTDPGDR